MNIKKVLMLLFLTSGSLGVASAQSRPDESSSAESLELKMKGTFQIIVYGESAPQMTNDILRYIDSKRDANKIIILKYNDSFSIRIFPSAMVDSGSFSRDTYPLYVYRNKPVTAKEQPSGKLKFTNQGR